MATWRPKHRDVRFYITCYSPNNYVIHRVVADSQYDGTDRFSEQRCVSKTIVGRFTNCDDANHTLDTLNGVAS